MWKILRKGKKSYSNVKAFLGRVLLSLMLIASMTGCSSNSNEEPKNNLDKNIEKYDSQIQEYNKNSENMTLDDRIKVATFGCKVYKEGDVVENSDMKITVNSAYPTKEKLEWFDYDVIDRNDEDEMYIIVNVDIIPNKEEIDFGKFGLESFDDSKLVLSWYEFNEAEYRYQQAQNGNNANNKNYKCKVKAGEKINTNLVFTMEDEEWKKNMHFLFEYNPEGLQAECCDSSLLTFVHIESMEGISGEKITKK